MEHGDADGNLMSPPANSPTGERFKLINDSVHSHIELRGHVLDVLDTPAVQRLRDLKQLGTTYMVFPGASHNRFEHCVGTSHLAGELVRGMYSNPRDPHIRRGIFESEHQFEKAVRLTEIAGLCHDLGHGPFSHCWDHVFLPKVTRHGAGFHEHPNTQHEARSIMLFEDLCDKYQIDLEKEEIRAVSAMIQGGKPSCAEASSLVPAFVFDIVANSKHGIDVDKLDYISRDVMHLNLPLGFDFRRLMRFSKVVGEDICFHRKEVYSVYHLFLTRFQLHRSVYNHRTALSLDSMIMDAFLEADKHLGISECIYDPESFLRLSDWMVYQIEHSRDIALKSAREIITRVRRRHLYRFVDECLLPPGSRRSVTEQDIVSYQDSGSSGVELRPEDIVICNVKLNFGRGDANPVDTVHFFRDWEDFNPVQIPSTKFSYVLPAVFEERIVRVYLKRYFPVKEEELRAQEAVRRAFRRCVKKLGVGVHLPSPTTLDPVQMSRLVGPVNHELNPNVSEEAGSSSRQDDVDGRSEQGSAKRRRPG